MYSDRGQLEIMISTSAEHLVVGDGNEVVQRCWLACGCRLLVPDDSERLKMFSLLRLPRFFLTIQLLMFVYNVTYFAGLYRGSADIGIHLRRLYANKVMAYGRSGAQGADTKGRDSNASGSEPL